jgi:uncharacterized damage-inducible protein DinB
MLALQRYRDVLLRDIEALDIAALDWQAAPQAVSIGTSLLHIAAVEFLVMSAVAMSRDDARPSPDRALWSALQPGFARELALSPNTGQPCSHYVDLLQQVRSASETALNADWRPLSLEQAQHTVLERLGLDPDQQRRLQAPLGLPLSIADGTRRESLILALIAHESYHRGQITQTKFLHRSGSLPFRAGKSV